MSSKSRNISAFAKPVISALRELEVGPEVLVSARLLEHSHPYNIVHHIEIGADAFNWATGTMDPSPTGEGFIDFW